MILTCLWNRKIARLLAGGVAGFLGMLPLPALCGDASVTDDVYSVRYGVSSSMFVEVNEADGSAAMKVWAEASTSRNGLSLLAEPCILRNQAEVRRAVGNGLVDVVALTTLEYLDIDPAMREGSLLVSVVNDRLSDVYLLLVRADSGFADIGDLRGRSLILCDNPKMCLAPIWLDTLLRERRLGAADGVFGRVAKETKLTKVVLPVFFGTVDACVVSREGYATMRELNPQLGSQLRELAASPEFVATLAFFRAGCDATLRERMTSAARNLHTNQEGKQLLVLFKCDRVVAAPPSCLDTARELVAKHATLLEGGEE
jgi:hypothetical protein